MLIPKKNIMKKNDFKGIRKGCLFIMVAEKTKNAADTKRIYCYVLSVNFRSICTTEYIINTHIVKLC